MLISSLSLSLSHLSFYSLRLLARWSRTLQQLSHGIYISCSIQFLNWKKPLRKLEESIVTCIKRLLLSGIYCQHCRAKGVPARVRLAGVLNFKWKGKESPTLQCAPSLDACFSSIVNTMSLQLLLLWGLLLFLKVA